MTGLVVFAHGSPVESANLPVRDLAREVGTRVGAALSEVDNKLAPHFGGGSRIESGGVDA